MITRQIDNHKVISQTRLENWIEETRETHCLTSEYNQAITEKKRHDK